MCLAEHAWEPCTRTIKRSSALRTVERPLLLQLHAGCRDRRRAAPRSQVLPHRPHAPLRNSARPAAFGLCACRGICRTRGGRLRTQGACTCGRSGVLVVLGYRPLCRKLWGDLWNAEGVCVCWDGGESAAMKGSQKRLMDVSAQTQYFHVCTRTARCEQIQWQCVNTSKRGIAATLDGVVKYVRATSSSADQGGLATSYPASTPRTSKKGKGLDRPPHPLIRPSHSHMHLPRITATTTPCCRRQLKDGARVARAQTPQLCWLLLPMRATQMATWLRRPSCAWVAEAAAAASCRCCRGMLACTDACEAKWGFGRSGGILS